MTPSREPPERHARSSRRRYRRFVEDYRHGRLDDRPGDAAEPGASPGAPPTAPGPRWRAIGRSAHLGAYVRWLAPHRYGVGLVFVLALAGAGLTMIEPLFMRFIIDRVLLDDTIGTDAKLRLLSLAGGAFVGVVVLTQLLNVLKDYRQRLLNNQVMLSLRRSLFDRLLHLPLQRLWEMKTGGILSRITGDVGTTTGLLQLAIVSPAISVVRLVIAGVILLNLNWRLALTALAIIPGIVFVSFSFARRVRPIYRSLRKDAEEIDGRVGETFSGIRVVRAFGRELRELLVYLSGRHAVLRKEMFAQRREMVIWTAWGLLLGSVNVVIVWYGGYLNITDRATIGDIMAFQWYTFLLLNPVWNIVNSFSELQRSLAAMERVFDVLGMEADKPDRPGAIDARASCGCSASRGSPSSTAWGRPWSAMST
jgi:ATP-binding cassette subfamily B protein/subfamily B ATP-binding cassette protein MsbA